MPSQLRRRVSVLAALGAVLLVEAAFHFYRLASAPQGLYGDETSAGMYALRTLRGGYWPIFVGEDYQGHEALFHYVVGVSIALFGRTPGALRLPGELASLGTMVGIYLATSVALDRRRALLASLIYGVTIWPILMARFASYRPPLPLLMAFFLWLSILAWRTNRARHWAGAGALLALAFYTNPAARVFPLVLILGAAYLALRRELRRLWPGGLYAALVCAVLLLPLGVYALMHPDLFFRRAGATLIFTPGMPPRAALALLWSQTYKVLRMFTFAGDWNPLNNIWLPGSASPPKPVFDLWLAIPFFLGHFVMLRRWRSRLTVFYYIWAGVSLLPSILTDEAPHYGRALLLLPVLFVWPAEGLAGGGDWLSRHLGRMLGLAVPGFLLMLAIRGTLREIVLDDRYGQRWIAAEYDDGRYAEMAVEANRFLGQGWVGDNLRALQPTSRKDRRVVIDWTLWRFKGERNLLEFLVGSDNPAVELIQPEAAATATSQETLLFLPVGHGRKPLDFFSPGMSVSAHPGGWTWNVAGDTRQAPMYWAYTATRPSFDATRPPIACWMRRALCLQAFQELADDDGTRLEFTWRGEPGPGIDPQLQIGYLGAGSSSWSETEALAADALPFREWRPDMYVVTTTVWPGAAGLERSPVPFVLAILPSALAASPIPSDDGAVTLTLPFPDH